MIVELVVPKGRQGLPNLLSTTQVGDATYPCVLWTLTLCSLDTRKLAQQAHH